MTEKSVAQMRADLRTFYVNKIKPELGTINRLRTGNRYKSLPLIIFVFGVILCLISRILPDSERILALGIPFVAVGLIFLIFQGISRPANVADYNCETDIKKKYMPEFLQIFGSDMKTLDHQLLKTIVKDSNIYQRLNIMTPYLGLSFDDTICGKYRGVDFHILEADASVSGNLAVYVVAGICILIFLNILKDLSIFLVPFALFVIVLIILLKSLINVPFRGVFVEFVMNKNFEGHTFVLERARTSLGIKFDHSKFEEVKLEDPEFMKKYKIYSDNQVEARYVLTTAFIERFKNMKVAFRAKYIRAAFKDGKITIVIDAGRDLFQMANLGKETDSNTFTELFNEILSILELINALKLNEKIGL